MAEALILGTMMVGQATAFAPNYNKAVLAAARVFRLLDRKPLIDSRGQSGLRLVRKSSNPLFSSRKQELIKYSSIFFLLPTLIKYCRYVIYTNIQVLLIIVLIIFFYFSKFFLIFSDFFQFFPIFFQFFQKFYLNIYIFL